MILFHYSLLKVQENLAIFPGQSFNLNKFISFGSIFFAQKVTKGQDVVSQKVEVSQKNQNFTQMQHIMGQNETSQSSILDQGADPVL